MGNANQRGGAYPLFKGATRTPTFLGVPLIPLIFMAIGVATVAMLVSMWWWALLAPAWALMAIITRFDDQAFRKIGLWIDTQGRNLLREFIFHGSAGFWGGSSYGTHSYEKRNHRVAPLISIRKNKG